MSGIQGDAFRPGAEPSSIRNINVRNYANFDAILSALERFQCNPEPTPEMTAHVTHLINGASCDSIRKNADWVRTVVSKFRINCDLNYSAALNAGDKAGQQRWSFIQPPASIIEARREKLVDCRRATPAFRENFFRVIDYNCPPSHQAEIRRFLLRALTAGLLPSEITSLIKERLGPINASHRPLIVQIFRCMPPERSEMIDELISFAPLLRTTPEALFIDTELLDWLRDYWKRNPDSNRVYSMDLVRLCRRPLLVLKLMLEDGCAPHLLMECAIRQYGTHMSFWNNDLRFLEDALTRMAPLTHPLGQRMRKIITDAYANKRLWIGTLPTVLKHIPFPHLPLDQIQSEFQGEQLLDLLLTWDQHNLRDKVAPLSDISLLDVEDLTAEVVLGPQSRFSDAFKIQFLALSLCRSGSEQFEALLDQDLLLKEGFVEKLLDFLKAQDESVLNSSTPTGIVLSKMQGDSDRIGGDRLIQLINGDSSLLNKEFLRKWQAQIEEALNSTDLSFRGTLSQSTFSCLLAVHAQCRNKKLSKFILRLLEETFPMPKRSSHGQTFNLPVPSPDIEWGNHSYPAAWRRELKRLLGESRPEVALAPPESTAVVIFAGLVQESTRKISKALPIYFDRNDTTTIIEQLLSGPLHPIRLYVDTQTRRIELRYLHPDHMGLQEKQYASISTLESQLEKDIKNVEDAWNSRLRELATSIEGLDTSYTGVTELKVENGRSWLKVPVATDTLQKFRVRTSDCVDHTRLHTSIKGARNLEKVLSSIFPPDTDPHQMHRMKREQQQRVRENGLIPLARTYLNADASTSVILWDLTFKSATLYINGHKHVLKLTDPAIVEKVLAILAEERVIGELLRQFIWIPSHGVLGPHPARPLPTLDPQDSACNVFKQKITETLLQPIEQNGKYHYDGGEYSLQDILKRLQNLEGAIDGKTVYLLPAQKISTYQQLRNDLRLVAEHIQTAQSAGALNALMRLVHSSDFC
ncbi:MAG: hypothetical protein KDK78_02070, partial [Chlamydiia bacterium]|nr:hypothetical protein [Chlamydiia bacterium]